jgi:hypothetical protein
MLSRLADLNAPVGGLNIWLGLRWYPLCQLLYYAGIGALSSENYEAFGHLFRARSRGAHSDEPTKLVFAQANAGVADAHDAFKLLPGHERNYVPRSERTYKSLQPLLEDLIFLGGAYEDLFDRFEVISALAHADQRLEMGHPWGPPGRFLWKARQGNDGPLAVICQEAEAAGDAWPLLRSGLFRGSGARFQQVAAAYQKFISGMVWS